MKRFIWPLLLFTLVLTLSSLSALANAADDTPKITSFTTPYTKVDRAGLANRTVRVPVEWTTANRPLTANLFFEQILPDNSAINVELPRVIPWVSSSGKGTAAPILPGSDATSIVLRVRLVNLLTGQTLDEQRLTLPIDTVGGQASDAGGRPSITRFVTSMVNVRTDALKNRSARIPVSWTATNRAATSNLIFEQILPDGSARNVELPRDNPWVASAGDGMTAPTYPGDNVGQITLRLRLVDLLTGRVLDQRSLTVQVDSSALPAPSIRFFITSANNVGASELAQRSARVPVSWSVDNRVEGTNLVFEQVLANGGVINVELPRSNPYVSSSGNGVASPALPGSGSTIRLRLRLVDLTTSATLDARELVIPISGIAGTPAPTATPPFYAQVVTFTADKSSVHWGDSVYVTWNVLNVHHVSLTLSATAGDSIDMHMEDLPANGSTLFSIPAVKWPVRRAVLNLNAYTSAGGPIAFSVPYVFTLACDTHFYDQSSMDCMTSEPTPVNAASETFERGFMVWRGDSRTVWALYNSGSGARIVEGWTGGDITWSDPTPNGRTLPQHGFGQVWTSVEPIRTNLGWALGPEQGYTGMFQTAVAADTGAAVDYFTTPDGKTYRYQDFGWSFVK